MLNFSRSFQPLVYTVLAFCISATLIEQASASVFYRWTDKDGSTRYTQTPPPAGQARTIKKVFVDDSQPGSMTTSNGTTVTDANQAANNQAGQIQPTNPVNQNQPTAGNAPAQTTTVTMTPPPSEHLIAPTQEQARPVFSEPAR